MGHCPDGTKMQREIAPRWSARPAELRLTENQVDVWRIDLGRAQDVSDRDWRGYTHQALHGLLAAYLACRPDELRLARESGGKPYLPGHRHEIQFNLSHSRDMALVAVSRSFQVGIDIETRRTIDDPLRLARRVMSATELAELEALPLDHRCGQFLRLWTRMEARQKALGLGVFSAPADRALLASFDFQPYAQGYASLCVSPPDREPALRFLEYVPL